MESNAREVWFSCRGNFRGVMACENYLKEMAHIKDSQNPRKYFQGNLQIFSGVSYK